MAPSAVIDDLRRAIAERRQIAFTLNGHARVAEPHDFGMVRGELRLFFFQIGGTSRSGSALGWRWAAADKIVGLRLLDERFAGARPTHTLAHVQWDTLLASVSDAARAAEAGTERPRPPRRRR